MTNYGHTPFPRQLRGIRDSLPPNYVVGRLSSGNGRAELIPIADLVGHPITVQKLVQVTGQTGVGGDLSGTVNAATVVGIQGRAVSANAPSNNQTLVWSGTAWVPGGGAWGSFIVVDATHYYVAMVDSLADPELVYSGGIPVYVLNPGFTP